MPPWSFSELVLFLTAYSFVGWCFESLFCTVFIDRKWVNRGFLAGPVCPIYGVGAVGVLLVSLPLMRTPALVFLASLALTSVLEFFTSWLLEKLFAMRWWDYSHCRFNLQGRVCLKNALFFGLMGLSVVYGLHPPVERLIGRIPSEWQRALASAVILLFAANLLRTLGAIEAISQRIRDLRAYLVELERYNEEHTWFDRQDIPGSIERLRAVCAEEADNERAAAILHTLDGLTKRPRDWRIAHNARMQIEGMQVALEGLRGSWDARMERERERAQSRRQRLAARLRGAFAGLAPRRGGLNFRKVVILFAVSGTVGCVLKTAGHFVATGVIESRQGVLYGPFHPLYGIGAVLAVWLLGPLARRGAGRLFLAGAVLGGAVQFAGSWAQERLFGAVGWRYESLAIGGRTDLVHMLLWGLLTVVLVRVVHPRHNALLDRIPKRQGVFLSWVMVAVLGVNLLLSAAAVSRWTDRQRGVPAETALARRLDERFPDPLLEDIFPNLSLVEDDC